jgi:hypothetical protein
MTDTLKSICEQCTHLNNPQLDFIPEDLQRYKKIIRRDLAELVLAASHGLEKSVVALAGSLLEAVLYCYLKSQEFIVSRRHTEPIVLSSEEGLQTYVNIFRRFRRYFSSELSADLLPPVAVDYRDLIHIDREVSSDPDFCSKAASDLLVIVDAVLGEFTKTVG